MSWRLNAWIEKNVPKKDMISRDAVEILMKLLWEEAKSVQRAETQEEEFERMHGPRDI